MKNRETNNTRVVGLICATFATMLSFWGVVSLSALPLALQFIGSLLVGALVYSFFELATKKDERNNKFLKMISRLVSIIIFAAIIVSTYTAIGSLWVSSFSEGPASRYVFENIATGTGFGAIVLTLILTTLQNDTYWVTKRKPGTLDEREVKERQQVFEVSYKIAAFLVLGAVWYFKNTIHNIPAIMENNYGTIPGHLYWAPLNLAVFLFALPLMIAAWKKR